MLEKYFVRPQTVDRIRAAWIGPAVEKYVEWLAARGYAIRNVVVRVPHLMTFGEFAAERGARTWEDLPAHVDSFMQHWLRSHARGRRSEATHAKALGHARGFVEQFLRVLVPGFTGTGRPRRGERPFERRAPGFFGYLQEERGLRPATLIAYGHQLAHFEAYLDRIGLADLRDLSPAVLSAFSVARGSQGVARTTVRSACGAVRVFLRYLHRERLMPEDLSRTVEWPQAYRLSTVPRSIPWADVRKMLDGVDRRTPCGRRDYAILLLLVTYGLRAREVTALTLDDIDWRSERLRIPERKAAHSTAFPLSPVVGEALVAYIRDGRPSTTSDRHVFFRALAPFEPLQTAAVSCCAARYLRRAGVVAPRLGSHTLRHACVQRLVDADFAPKVIADYVGHRSPSSTAIYAKVAVEALRQVALGDGEDVL